MFKMHKDGTIVLPQGDTFTQNIELTGKEFPAGTVAVFGVMEHVSSLRRQSKAFAVENGRVTIDLKSEETKKLKPGEYMWDMRIVVNPVILDNGSAAVGEYSSVLSVFSGSRLPKMIVTEVTADV